MPDVDPYDPNQNHDARERLARHLYVTFCGTAPGWDDPTRAPLEGRDRWRERADAILAVIAGKEG